MGTSHLYQLLGFTPLHAAVSSRRADEVERALQGGANVDAVAADGFTPLMLAVRHRAADLVALLIEHGADARIRDGKGRSPWHEAVRRQDRRTMDLLAGAGAAHHALENSFCSLCHIPEASFGDLACRPGSRAALEARLASLRKTYIAPHVGESTGIKWRPDGLPRRVLAITIVPSLRDHSEAWELREDRSTDPEHRLVGVHLRWSAAGGLDMYPFPLERAPVEKLLARLRDAKITTLPSSPPLWFDGTQYHLLLEGVGADVELSWWEEGPREWRQLVSAARELLSFLEDRKAVHGGRAI